MVYNGQILSERFRGTPISGNLHILFAKSSHSFSLIAKVRHTILSISGLRNKKKHMTNPNDEEMAKVTTITNYLCQNILVLPPEWLIIQAPKIDFILRPSEVMPVVRAWELPSSPLLMWKTWLVPCSAALRPTRTAAAHR